MPAAARPAIRVLLVAPVLFGLAGCFQSETRLIAEADAAFPFKTMTLKTEDGETGILQQQGKVYVYDEPGSSSSDDDGDQTVQLYQVGDGLYIAQHSDQDGEATYIFAKKTGDTILTRADCRGLDAATLSAANVKAPQKATGIVYRCRADDLKSLIALARSPAIWAEHTTTLQIVSIE